MAIPSFSLSRSIVLDQNHFQVAAEGLENLSEELRQLENRISGLLEELEKGFKTPAGARFFAAVNGRLLAPMRDQAEVFKHVSENLNGARNTYRTVFDRYEELNNEIRNNQLI